MSQEPSQFPEESLGDYLRNTRTSKGLCFAEIANETKISIKNLMAMEENNFNSLPAEVFTRGFYTLYSRVLSLDPGLILKRYDSEKSCSIKDDAKLLSTCKNRHDYENLAERPNSLPFSYVGVFVLFFLVSGAFLSWYFSWNPATYLSQKIQNGQEGPQQRSQLKSPEKEFFELQNMLSIPATSNASEIKQQFKYPVISTDAYIVKAKFKETTKVTLAIDDNPVYDSVYEKGESAAWSAKNKINITLPGNSTTYLSLNKTQIHLPKTDNATLTVSLPNDLQE
jgi:cytoskeletal protein RodZ